MAIILITCLSLIAVDGDTIKCDDENLRLIGDGKPFISGFDTPELPPRAKCHAEAMLAKLAKKRLKRLLKRRGLRIENTRQRDRFNRQLVVVRLKGGKTIGRIMLEEGLAKTWFPHRKINWCG